MFKNTDAIDKHFENQLIATQITMRK